jgi:hypothetical protein
MAFQPGPVSLRPGGTGRAIRNHAVGMVAPNGGTRPLDGLVGCPLGKPVRRTGSTCFNCMIPAQRSGATSWTVAGIPAAQSMLVVVTPDGHRTLTPRNGCWSV